MTNVDRVSLTLAFTAGGSLLVLIAAGAFALVGMIASNALGYPRIMEFWPNAVFGFKVGGPPIVIIGLIYVIAHWADHRPKEKAAFHDEFDF